MEDDDCIKPVSSSKRRKLTVSSDSDEEMTPEKTRHSNESESDNARSSERIQKKKNRSFQMPSRSSVWDSIEDSKEISPGKLQMLRPRKLINDHIKVSNRYNFDRFESSGSESMEQFIVDDFEEDGLSSSSEDEKKSRLKPTKHRVRNHRRRLKVDSDSEEEDDEHKDLYKREQWKTGTINTLQSDSNSDTLSDNCKISHDNELNNKKGGNSHGMEQVIKDSDGNDGEIQVTPARRKTNIIDSESEVEKDAQNPAVKTCVDSENNYIGSKTDDDDDDDDDDDNNNDENVLFSAKKNKCYIIESESSSAECDIVDQFESSSESSDDGQFSNLKSSRARQQIKQRTKARTEIFKKMKEKRERRLSAGKSASSIPVQT